MRRVHYEITCKSHSSVKSKQSEWNRNDDAACTNCLHHNQREIWWATIRTTTTSSANGSGATKLDDIIMHIIKSRNLWMMILFQVWIMGSSEYVVWWVSEWKRKLRRKSDIMVFCIHVIRQSRTRRHREILHSYDCFRLLLFFFLSLI